MESFSTRILDVRESCAEEIALVRSLIEGYGQRITNGLGEFSIFLDTQRRHSVDVIFSSNSSKEEGDLPEELEVQLIESPTPERLQEALRLTSSVCVGPEFLGLEEIVKAINVLAKKVMGLVNTVVPSDRQATEFVFGADYVTAATRHEVDQGLHLDSGSKWAYQVTFGYEVAPLLVYVGTVEIQNPNKDSHVAAQTEQALAAGQGHLEKIEDGIVNTLFNTTIHAVKFEREGWRYRLGMS